MSEDFHKIEGSSQVDQVHYDPASQRLQVKFHGGGHYSYAGVPQQRFDGLLSAPSKGKYLNSTIKGKYKHEKHS